MVKFNPFTGEFDFVGSASGGVATTPAGADREIQINDSGAFGAVTGFSIDAGGVLSLPSDVALLDTAPHTIKPIAATVTTADGSSVIVAGGNSGITSGAGGDIGINGGDATTEGDGGDVTFATGTPAGAGVAGKFLFNQNIPGASTAELDFSGITAPRAFVYPDTSGTVALTSDIATAVTGLLDFKGATDASANPNYPVGSKGDAYVISVAGKIGGASGKSVDVGDVYIAVLDNAGGTEAAVGTSWVVLEHNLVGALLGTNNLSDLTNTTTARDNLGVEIGVDVQAFGATLTSLEALSLVQGDLLYATAADTMARLAKGTGLQELRMNAGATAPEWFTPSASSGQTLVTHIVAASGGTHTTLGAAIAAAAAGDTIWVREGTYAESAISTSLTNLTIIGENPKSSIISIGGNNMTFSGADVEIMNVNITSTGGIVTMSGARARVHGVRGLFTSANQCFDLQGLEPIFTDNRIENASAGIELVKTNSTTARARITNNTFRFYNLPSSSTTGIFLLNGVRSIFSNNVINFNFAGTSANSVIYGNNNNLVIANNTFTIDNNQSARFVTLTSSAAESVISGNTMALVKQGIVCDAARCSITGNYIKGDNGEATDVGIRLSTSNNVVSGNMINGGGTGVAGIDLTSSASGNVITGNRCNNTNVGVKVGSSTNSNNTISDNDFTNNTTIISDAGTGTSMWNNMGATAKDEKRVIYMKNTSGATINAGNIVTLKAVAAGDEVTTTTTASDNQMYGVATAAITNNSYGYIQVLGKTTILTVDGTADIAIGDFITTFTTAGIGKKAAAATLGVTLGDLAIAIALEAYTTDNSSGVIDALIITPRRL